MKSLVRRSPRLVARRRYATLVGTDQHGHGANKETLVVVGGGWAGYNFVRKLDKVSTSTSHSSRLDSSDPSFVSHATTSSASVAAPTLSLLRSSPAQLPDLSASATLSNLSGPPRSSPSTTLGPTISTSPIRPSPVCLRRVPHFVPRIRS
jgi:hypothetical protein